MTARYGCLWLSIDKGTGTSSKLREEKKTEPHKRGDCELMMRTVNNKMGVVSVCRSGEPCQISIVGMK